MKHALIEIPYGLRLMMPLDQLGALQHATLVKGEGYGRNEKFTVADPESRLDIQIRDDREIAPYEPPQPDAPDAPADKPAASDEIPL